MGLPVRPLARATKEGMMRRTFVMTLGVLLLVGAATALARATYPTSILEKYSEPVSGLKYRSLGLIESPKAACLPGRTVIAKSYAGSQLQYTDRDTTSKNGAWELRFKAYKGGHVTLKVTSKRIGRHAN